MAKPKPKPAAKGHPKWGGMQKGYKYPETLAKEHQEAILRTKIEADASELYESLKNVALGVSHMMAKAKDGTWQEVTDPSVMAKVLNSGEQFYQIHARNPDARALKDLFDRLCGTASQAVAVDAKVEHTFRWQK